MKDNSENLPRKSDDQKFIIVSSKLIKQGLKIAETELAEINKLPIVLNVLLIRSWMDSVVFPDRKMILSIASGFLIKWELETGIQRKIYHQPYETWLKFSVENNKLFVWTYKANKFGKYDINREKIEEEFNFPNQILDNQEKNYDPLDIWESSKFVNEEFRILREKRQQRSEAIEIIDRRTSLNTLDYVFTTEKIKIFCNTYEHEFEDPANTNNNHYSLIHDKEIHGYIVCKDNRTNQIQWSELIFGDYEFFFSLDSKFVYIYGEIEYFNGNILKIDLKTGSVVGKIPIRDGKRLYFWSFDKQKLLIFFSPRLVGSDLFEIDEASEVIVIDYENWEIEEIKKISWNKPLDHFNNFFIINHSRKGPFIFEKNEYLIRLY